jgi:hypothetical protein
MIRTWINFLFLAAASIPVLGHSNTILIQQLTTPEYKEDVPDHFSGKRDSGYSTHLRLPGVDCEHHRDVCFQAVNASRDDLVIGFQFSNKTANRVNPRTSPHGSNRAFRFRFPERSRRNINIAITEDAGISGLMSHDLLETTVLFVPRLVIPYIEHVELGSRSARRVFLPTLEPIYIDAISHEIISGVLSEGPMDMNPSRHERNFIPLNYSGKGIMIRADRRAGTPEHIYSQSFNRNERIREATLTYRGRTCHVPKNLIWENGVPQKKWTLF